jgi:hypothetical protein
MPARSMMTPAQLAAARRQLARQDAAPGPRPREKKPRKPQRREEAALLKQVLAWLKLKGWLHWRANAGGGLRRGRGGRMVPIRGNAPGTPDVLCVLPAHGAYPAGRLAGFELKSPAGKLSPDQKAWVERAESGGVLCLVIRSLGGLIEALAAEGVTP